MTSLVDDLQRLIPDPTSRAQPDPTAKLDLEHAFAAALGVDASAVYSVNVPKAGNLSKALVQSDRGRRASIAVALVLPSAQMDHVIDSARKRVGPGQKRALVLVSEDLHGIWVVSAVVEQPGGRVAQLCVNTGRNSYSSSLAVSWFHG
ncbi:hypothetical protein [Couchioplanes azureus]|uniref:hypothetical protein n=1 Tax=Couchioplanes caeruleus TaxID=56438 RepID=UPI0016714412|nr:hypothetical protein [Couchioplanes caeruleus]GGQ44682.1 hypothetical protein GCM10010166_11540 [Couchioplanes caeruleus subsp. azureus]